ncbi:carboxylesterase/lipase family protein [Corynebacterium yudongzhengii]|uniref:Carboxylic ester hydrolase n=1 Tax=Corynebacterium yudongzhengii TaxID=2080740 RepID=A0A2U1T881_9CORY|nr:carboxylesterase family protein [Corynebacterium yudongzhengii]AWB82722.1 carboxylesterase/lipase family protein [Corynebacterium yudongzhengii]PWC02217.1 carboxylesterase/lipase family protein [Corynebacterium yudongzhengii]
MSTVEIADCIIRGRTIDAPASPGASADEADKAQKVTAFYGIPYAQAPTGERRFFPPAPARLQGELSAETYGPTAAQNQYPEAALAIVDNPLIAGNERLNLNVWTPDTAGKAPVYVFIHGGAYRHGSGASETWNGASFAAQGIVAVTLNYRLGAEGGIQLEDGTSNNMLRDQIAALEWVRDQIAAFGGDPEHVVVGGESAGAMSIGALLASPKAKGLFHAAILESGAAHNVVRKEGAVAVGKRFAESLGVEPTAEALGSLPEEQILQASAEIEAEIGQAAGDERYADLAGHSMTWQPSIDGDVLPQHPLDVLSAGEALDVPVLIGTNQDEGTMFVAGQGLYEDATAEHVVKAARVAGAADPEAVAKLATDEANPHPGASLTTFTDMWKFQLPLRDFLKRRKNYSAPTYRYKFTWASPKFGGLLGAYHMLELPFVFNSVDTQATKATAGEDLPKTLVAAAHGAWVSFIKNFDPGWKPYFDAETTTTGVLDANGLTVAEDLDEELLSTWEDYR